MITGVRVCVCCDMRFDRDRDRENDVGVVDGADIVVRGWREERKRASINVVFPRI